MEVELCTGSERQVKAVMTTSPDAYAPLFGSLSFMTLNINGMITKVKKGNRKLPKFVMLTQYMRSKDLDIADIQELHFVSNAAMSKVTAHLKALGYQFYSNCMSEGRGGAALI